MISLWTSEWVENLIPETYNTLSPFPTSELSVTTPRVPSFLFGSLLCHIHEWKCWFFTRPLSAFPLDSCDVHLSSWNSPLLVFVFAPIKKCHIGHWLCGVCRCFPLLPYPFVPFAMFQMQFLQRKKNESNEQTREFFLICFIFLFAFFPFGLENFSQ